MSQCKIVVIDISNNKTSFSVDPGHVKSLVCGNGTKFNCDCKESDSVPENVYFAFNGKLCIFLNSYSVAFLVNTISRSREFRTAWLNHVGLQGKRIYVLEFLPHTFYLDKAWSRRMEYLARERAEVEHAFSWFSTLGGAFSALGDSFNHCAVMAGKISGAQLKLAIRLGDPIMKGRCYLYMALSIAQQGELKKAKQIVRLVKRSQPCLTSICQGVSAHFYRLKKTTRGS